MRKQYHFRRIAGDLHAWDVHRLIRLAQSLPVQKVALQDIGELDENWWFAEAADLPSPRALAGHMLLVNQADLAYPILLCAEGRVMDGMHRLVKALVLQQDSLPAIRFARTPPPDFINPVIEDLPYPDEEI